MKNFLIGCATASHQNEGYNIHNNWYNWEKINKIPTSGICCNSWFDYEKDILCLKELGCDAYRFSLEWSRIMPKIKTINYKALNKYEKMVDCCIKHQIEPVITLHHFTRPLWVDEVFGGLHNEKINEYFLKYVGLVLGVLGKKVKYWITFNEPMLEIVHGYLRGTRPPGRKGDFEGMYWAIVNILELHSLTYDLIKNVNPKAMVSIAKNLVFFEKRYCYDVLKSSLEDQIIEHYNWCILDAFHTGELKFGIDVLGIGKNWGMTNVNWRNKLDFIGVNHYNVGYVDISFLSAETINVLLEDENNNLVKNVLKWDIHPESIIKVLNMVRNRYNHLKIMITESGSTDPNQMYFMDTHLKNILNYQLNTGNLLGVMWWTLMDNFEWEDGYLPKFGLYSRKEKIDEKHQITIKRKIKPSGHYFMTIIGNFKSTWNKIYGNKTIF